MGIVKAVFSYYERPFPAIFDAAAAAAERSRAGDSGLIMIRVPLANAGRPEDPAPPTAIM
jgi:hypothetical protein